MPPSYAIIIPVHNEEAALPKVLAEFESLGLCIAVGLNACVDRSEEIALAHRVLVGRTASLGYGHGCHAAMEAVKRAGIPVAAWIIVAGDGANDVESVRRLIAKHEATGAPLVLGQRTRCLSGWTSKNFGFRRGMANVLIGAWVSVLTKHPCADLGPLRLIAADWVDRLHPSERAHGWTVEGQVRARRLGLKVEAISVIERPRLAGAPKVTGVSLKQSFRVGLAILVAAWRARFC